jgi:hypothetical protein
MSIRAGERNGFLKQKESIRLGIENRRERSFWALTIVFGWTRRKRIVSPLTD